MRIIACMAFLVGCGLGQDSEECSPESFWPDGDGDGFGAGTPVAQCSAPAGHVSNNDDCDDTSEQVAPGAPEVCNGFDDDCNGQSDDQDPGLQGDIPAWFLDADLDGHGDPETAVLACTGPPGRIQSGGDCDDADDSIHPGADEVCSGRDEDCDGLVDDEDPDRDPASATVWFRDSDGDGYGDPDTATHACVMPEGMVLDSLDCDDTDEASHPSAPETCGDGVDQDCSGADRACPEWSSSYDMETDAFATVTSRSNDRQLGRYLDILDWNGDGNPDLAVSSRFIGGEVWILEGPLSPGPLDVELEGTARLHALSGTVNVPRNVGDLDADGDDELVIGGYDPYSYGGLVLGNSVSGAAYTVDARAFRVSCRNAASVGDQDGDGTLEWLCVDHLDLTLFEGTSDTVVARITDDITPPGGGAPAGFDYRLAVGDADGDGTDDVWTSQPTRTGPDGPSQGGAFLFLGPLSTTTSSDADADLLGTAEDDWLGASLAAGDVDDDGYADVIAGHPLDTTGGSAAGAVYVFLGHASGQLTPSDADITFRGEPWTILGEEQTEVADVDDDGANDIVLGAALSYGTYDAGGEGFVFYGGLASGTYSTADADISFSGVGYNERAGREPRVVRDLTAPGSISILFGATHYNWTGTRNGAVFIIEP